jgi:hypothetical protein
MLFDLRGRGRRRTVQVIYLGLAVLFLLGFVGFGVGVGGSGGGLFNALTENNGANSASFAGKVAAAEKHTKREPNNPKAWAALIEAEFHQAGEEKYSDPTTGQYTAQGKELLRKISGSWTTYLNLEPHNPNIVLAQHMITLYGEEGINEPAQAVQAVQLVIAAKPPSAYLYSLLAEYSYKAHNDSVGDLAAEKAVSLTPAAQRKQVKEELEAVKKNPTATSSSSSSTGTAPPSGTYTATVNGKPTVVKSSGNGTLTSVTPSSGGTHTTATKK